MGLKKQSYVGIHKLYDLSKKWVFSQQPIGKLTVLDRLAHFNFIKNNHPSVAGVIFYNINNPRLS